MKIAVPVAEYRGLESQTYGHFGSADCFVLVDTETMTVERLSNRDRAHVHGACSPMKALAGAKPNAVLVGGIGPGALIRLRQAGITVCRAPEGTVADAVRLFTAGELETLDAEATCASHAGGSECHCSH
jgi:predicted Fe-Mo cluster-binding NifX family protein